ncbi:MAG: HAD-IA family hydrolase [Candidatus Aenigmarchaeota archaeon]|nr:HAD-IA family hydrolase [Candidatus Aenigmarchaeota archaeon]
MIRYAIFDNDGTTYRMPEGFVEAVMDSLIRYAAGELMLSYDETSAERSRLVEKYRVRCTEFVFGEEYGMKYEGFVQNAYMKVPLEDFIHPDIRLARTLERMNMPKSILTNNPSEFGKRILELLGIADMFERVIGSREVGFRLKPEKEAFERALKITGYEPLETLFVDDTPENHACAKELGMTTVLMGQGEYPYVDYPIREIYDIERCIK